MSLFDAILILFLVGGTLVGLKRGVIKQSISFVGLILSFVLAFRYKNIVAAFLYERLPFFSFDGLFKGISSINIIIYELIAFFLVLGVLLLLLKVIGFITGIIEKVLTATVILGIPSKILGAIFGFLESYVIIFIVAYIMVQPFINFNIDVLDDSKVANFVFNNTPYVSGIADEYMGAFEEIYSIKDTITGEEDKDKLNKDVINILLKYEITTIDSLQILVDRNKIDESIVSEIKKESGTEE